MNHVKWAGSQLGFSQLEEIFQRMANATAEDLKKASDWEDEQDDLETEHHLLSMAGQVGIISIRGSMIDGSAGWWGRYYDVVGYDDIRNAVVCAVNAGAQQILVDIMSPGGMVVGIGELTDFLKEVHANVPITFFSGSYAASGGVWLATSTGAFYASRHAEVGSIGVIAVATEYSRAYDEMGITKTVFKSTPLKASGNPNEPLDAANAAEIQRGVDESALRFIDQIAQGMNLSSGFVAENLATGQVWYADEAVRLGLVSGITTFDRLLVDLQQKVNQNTNSNLGFNQGSTYQQHAEADMASRKRIKANSPEEALAMAASGLPVTSASDSVEPEDVIENEDEDLPVEDQNEDEEENVVEQTEASASAPVATATDTVGMLSAITDQLVSAKVELATVKAEAAVTAEKLAGLQAIELQLKQAVAVKVQRAMVAAGSPAPALESLTIMDSSLLLAQDAAAETMLAKRFGNGGQVSVFVDEEESEESKRAEAVAQYSDEVLAPLSRIFSK